jgi:HrpA-like RNA helicase
MKEMRFDPISNIASLQEVVISRSSARQRSGRAGRVKLGHCWKVYTEDFFNGSRIDEFPIPEIRRIPLEEVVLQVLFLKLGLPEIFLGECLEPPSMNQIRGSVRSLLDIRAILPLPPLPLTALGYHLAKIPVDIKIGKMLIISSLLNCVDPILTIAASIGGRSPFLSNLKNDSKISKAHKSFIKNDKFSDHLAIVNAYNEWNNICITKGKGGSYNYCCENYLSQPALEDIKKLREQFRQYLIDAGFLISSKKQNIDNEDNYVNDIEFDIENIEEESVLLKDLINSDNNGNDINMISRCALCAGLYPQLVRVSRFDNKDNHSKRGKGLVYNYFII